jgi:hypothetical protein
MLPSHGIDVILGMDWITTHKGVISTSPRLVTLVHPDGARVTFEPMKSRDIPAVYSLHTKAISDVPVVCEYEDVFPEELPGLPPDRDVEFVINLVPGTTPIAQSPYRMAEVELKLLKAELLTTRERVHPTKCFTMGFTGTVCPEEGWDSTSVRRLPRPKRGNHQEQVPTTQDR